MLVRFFFSAQFLASASSSLIVAILLKVMEGADRDNSLVAPWRCLCYVVSLIACAGDGM